MKTNKHGAIPRGKVLKSGEPVKTTQKIDAISAENQQP